MSMIRWDPFADITQLREQVNRLFEQSAGRSAAAQAWAPAVDILETEGALVLYVELAGVKREEIDIQVTGDTLTIKGERKAKKPNAADQYLRVERNYGAFQRSFTLGVPINQQRIHAAYTDGVLEVILPKQEEAKPKQIKVEIQDGPTEEIVAG